VGCLKVVLKVIPVIAGHWSTSSNAWPLCSAGCAVPFRRWSAHWVALQKSFVTSLRQCIYVRHNIADHRTTPRS